MLVNMPAQPSALAEINQRNERFWAERSELLNRQTQDAALCLIAMKDLSSEKIRKVPFESRKSFEECLAHADDSKTIILQAFSQKGGKAAKSDALQRWILDTVRGDEKISSGQLLIKIRKLAKKGDSIFSKVSRESDTSNDQTEHIYFDDNGESKTAPVTGLKDRLSRARKKIPSR
jgi:hypothetical protein